jgi:hypothetical protein
VVQANFRIAPLAGPLPLGASPGCEEDDLKILLGARSDATPKRTQCRRSRSPRNDQRPAQHALATTRQACRSPTKLWIWVCWHRPPNRQKRFSARSGSRSWPTVAISRSRTSRLARRPGSILTCRVHSEVHRSERAYTAKIDHRAAVRDPRSRRFVAFSPEKDPSTAVSLRVAVLASRGRARRGLSRPWQAHLACQAFGKLHRPRPIAAVPS